MDRNGKISVWSRYSAQILFYNHPQIPWFMQCPSKVIYMGGGGGGGGGGHGPEGEGGGGGGGGGGVDHEL